MRSGVTLGGVNWQRPRDKPGAENVSVRGFQLHGHVSTRLIFYHDNLKVEINHGPHIKLPI